ncbi:MAG: hypothetical protein LBT51_01250 [Fusobacteriaceae bacterium]|jgi:hypothetical protein|nr:hypothetical protein [Fusobacteriaceae bacterium]
MSSKFNKTCGKDLDRVFFRELAERIEFAGIMITVVISKDDYNKKYRGEYRHNKNPQDTGLTKFGIIVHAKTKDIPVKPKIGDEITVNGTKYEVEDVITEIGMYRIALFRINES